MNFLTWQVDGVVLLPSTSPAIRNKTNNKAMKFFILEVM